MTENCPDCGVAPGAIHVPGCDVERCPRCGRQAISCGCGEPDLDPLPWTGEWPGESACREFAWYSRLLTGRGWVACGPDVPGSGPDLNRLYVEAKWNPTLRRWERSRPTPLEPTATRM